jgi:hypothetical protein
LLPTEIGFALSVQTSTKPLFSSLCRELGNSELFWAIERHFSGDGGNTLSVTTAVPGYLAKKSFGGNSRQELSFVASHFSGIPDLPLQDLVLPDLEEIISHELLCVENEDSLFDLICDRGFSECFSLFEFVPFEYLSPDRVSLFVESIGEFGFMINFAILNRFSQRFVLPVDVYGLSDELTRYARKSKEVSRTEFIPSDSVCLDGIVAHLTRHCGGNVHARGAVAINSSRPLSDDPRYAAKNVVDLKADSVFRSAARPTLKVAKSAHTPNNSVCYDFEEHIAIPSHTTRFASRDSRVRAICSPGQLKFRWT